MIDELSLYLSEVRTVPLLKWEDEVALAKRINKGKSAETELKDHVPGSDSHDLLLIDIEDGQSARAELARSNMRLVISIAKKFRYRGLPFLDLIQEGNVGLITAVDKYDYTLGNRFSTYATWWIRQAVSRAIANFGRTIRIPTHLHTEMSKLYRAQESLHSLNGEFPTNEELSEATDIQLNKVEELVGFMRTTVSLERPVGDDKTNELVDFVKDAAPEPLDMVADKLLDTEVDEILKLLPEKEANILCLHYGINEQRAHTFREIGVKYGLSRERIRQIEMGALKKLRGDKACDGLRLHLA